MKRRTRVLLITAAAVLLAIAMTLNYRLEHLSERAKICNALAEYGYELGFDDIYVSGDTPDISIRELLEGIPLDAAVAASRAAGFPSDVDRIGDIVVLMAAISQDRVITIYTVDGQMELCFIQIVGSYEVEALCQE